MTQLYRVIGSVQNPLELIEFDKLLAHAELSEQDWRDWATNLITQAVMSNSEAETLIISSTLLTTRGFWYKPFEKELDWHQEGESYDYVLCWSNVPTELRVKGTNVDITPQPNSIVVFDNHLVEHRYPTSISPEVDRWFLRAVGRNRDLPTGGAL